MAIEEIGLKAYIFLVIPREVDLTYKVENWSDKWATTKSLKKKKRGQKRQEAVSQTQLFYHGELSKVMSRIFFFKEKCKFDIIYFDQGVVYVILSRHRQCQCS